MFVGYVVFNWRRLESWVTMVHHVKERPPQITAIFYEGFDAQSGPLACS